jgi:O-antigen/teichoic acid export membrane protein
LYSYAIAFASIFGVIATLGLDSIVVRDLVNHPENRSGILGTTFILKIVAGIGTYFLIFISSYAIHIDNPQAHWLISIISLGLIFQAWDTIDFWFQSEVQSKYTVFAKSTAFILVSLSKVILILVKAPLIAFAWAAVAEIFIGSLGLTITYLRRDISVKKLRYSRQLASQLIRDSAPLIFSGIMIMLYMRIDQIMLASMASEREVGLYAAAVRLAEAWYFIPSVIVPSIFPNLLATRQQDEKAFYTKLQSLYNTMAIIAYAISIPTMLLSSWIIHIFFGPGYSDAAPMLAVLIWSTLFVNLGIARSSFLTAMNWAHLHFMTVGFGCIVNIALNLVFIPFYGGLAASISTFIAYGFAVYIACFFHRKLFKTAKMLTRSIFCPDFRIS